MRENKLWTVDLQSREPSGLWVEGEKEKKAVLCLSVIWSPKRSAVVTHATSMCTCARHSCSISKHVCRTRCVLCQKVLSLGDLFGPLGGHWCYLTWWGILSYLMLFCSVCQALHLKCFHLKDGRWFAQSRLLIRHWLLCLHVDSPFGVWLVLPSAITTKVTSKWVAGAFPQLHVLSTEELWGGWEKAIWLCFLWHVLSRET